MSFAYKTSLVSSKNWFTDTFDTIWYLAEDWNDVLFKARTFQIQ